MYQGKKILGLISARGGSIGIPGKNIYPLNGKPLILYTVESAEKSQFLDALYCSTNDKDIAAVASSTQKCQIIWRPEELCTAESKSIDCVIHALDKLAEEGKYFDYLMLLQPTSPFRRTEDIDGCIRAVIDNNIKGCVSVSMMPYLPVLMRYTEPKGEGIDTLQPLLPGNGTCRRQDAKQTYYVDGCLYLYAVSEIMEKKSNLSLNDAPYGYKISQKCAADINTISDIQWCEYIQKQGKK